MRPIQRHTFALALVLLFGVLLFHAGTDGFRAFTAETARIDRLIREQPTFPEVILEDSKGRSYSFDAFKGKHVLVTFMYTTCKSICVQLEMNTALLMERLPASMPGRDIVFLSVSFDPDRDDRAALETYGGYFNSDGEVWRMARVADKAQLAALLRTYGVIVIPDDRGDFAHNAAFYLIDGTGALVDVLDYDKVDEAAEAILSRLGPREG